jgi:hypothetical protein
VKTTVPHKKLVRAVLALGGLLTVLAIFSVWADRQALDTDEWVNTSGTVLEDQEVQTALSEYMVNELYTNVDVEARLEQRLPPQLQAAAGPLSGALRQAAVSAGERAFDSAALQSAWKTANRAMHEQLLNLLDGNGKLVDANGGAVTLKLAPLVDQIAAQAGLSADVGDKLPPDVAELTIMKSDQIKLAQDVAKLLHGLSIVFTVLALLAFALAIYLSAGRRQRTLLWSGITLILADRRLAGRQRRQQAGCRPRLVDRHLVDGRHRDDGDRLRHPVRDRLLARIGDRKCEVVATAAGPDSPRKPRTRLWRAGPGPAHLLRLRPDSRAPRDPRSSPARSIRRLRDQRAAQEDRD